MTAQLVALHLGGVPEAAMFLGPVLLIIAFVRIARHNDATATADDADDWDPDLGDLAQPSEGGLRQPLEGGPLRAEQARRSPEA
jgi:hypothetical protein